MIEYTSLILTHALVDKLNKMKYQAIQDSQGFRMLITLAILQDVLQWSSDLGNYNSKRKCIDILSRMLANLSKQINIPVLFKTQFDVYTNVNIPQKTIFNTTSTLSPTSHIEEPEGMSWKVTFKSIDDYGTREETIL